MTRWLVVAAGLSLVATGAAAARTHAATRPATFLGATTSATPTLPAYHHVPRGLVRNGGTLACRRAGHDRPVVLFRIDPHRIRRGARFRTIERLPDGRRFATPWVVGANPYYSLTFALHGRAIPAGRYRMTLVVGRRSVEAFTFVFPCAAPPGP